MFPINWIKALYIISRAYEPLKERKSVFYRKVNGAAVVVSDSVAVIVSVLSSLAVRTVFALLKNG